MQKSRRGHIVEKLEFIVGDLLDPLLVYLPVLQRLPGCVGVFAVDEDWGRVAEIVMEALD
jgi:hypothetical protein